MAKKSEELGPALQALTEAAQALRAAATQMTQMMQAQAPAAAAAPPPPGAQVRVWEDDPFGEDTPTANPPLATPIAVPAPAMAAGPLGIQIIEPQPAAGLYDPGSANFRYWATAAALVRGITFWTPLLPPATRWTTTHLPMNVRLVTGRDLNANYSRQAGLRFYQQTVRGLQVFSCESPDVSCHELGHAILDAFKPELWDAASTEVAAFHESFGDMSALLSALQVDSLCQKVLADTDGHLNVNSRLSRLAEQLGWAIRQLSPTAVDADCLRNAANRFFYEDPDTLPPSAPASQLSSEVHSFSRVFTGAFLDALARMLGVAGPPTLATLQAVSRDLGQLLVDGILLARVSSGFYSQIAAAMIQADRTRNGGRYRAALTSGFVQHGILSPSAAAGLAQAPAPQPRAAAAGQLTFAGEYNEGYRQGPDQAPVLPTRAVTVAGMALEVHAPAEPHRFAAAAGALATGSEEAADPEDAACSFAEDLLQLGRIDFESVRDKVPAELVPPPRAERSLAPGQLSEERSQNQKTHTLVTTSEGKMVLKRRHFLCGFCT